MSKRSTLERGVRAHQRESTASGYLNRLRKRAAFAAGVDLQRAENVYKRLKLVALVSWVALAVVLGVELWRAF